MKAKRYTRQIVLRLEPPTFASLQAIADNTDRTVTEVVRYALQQYLQRQNDAGGPDGQ